MKDSPKILLPFALLGGQMIISYFQFMPLTILGFILGFIATFAFGFFFPLMFLYFWLSSFLSPICGEFVVYCFYGITSFFSKIADISGHYYGSIPLLICLTVLLFKIPLRVKVIFLLLCLTVHCAPLMNLPRKMFLGKIYKTDTVLDFNDLDQSKIKKVTTTTRGVKIEFTDKSYCHIHIYNYFHLIKKCL